MENAHLYAQLERSVTLEERHRIAAEMHDGLAQTLSFLLITTDEVNEQLETGDVRRAKQSLARVERGVDQASVEIRRAISSLHDEFPPQYTLQEQLGSLIQEFDAGDHHVVWENRANIPLVMEHQKSEQVLRVVREALINAQKHSQATQISVNLEKSNGTAIVNVVDNGIGFNPNAPPAGDDRPHFGLQIMQARAARLGGGLEIHSPEGQGTCVSLSWPLEVKPPNE
jgi:signal transduction histidine kinase